MDFALSPETQDTCKRIGAFLDRHVIPLESDPASYGEGENIRLDLLADLRKKARAENLWCLQIPKAEGGNGAPKGQTLTHMAACYEAAGRSIFGPVCFNIAAPDDGNLYLLNRVATPAQKEKWLNPILRGEARSAIVMTEPAPGSGSDPAGMMKTTATRHGDTWVIKGHKWVHHRRRRRRSFHPARPHLGRSAPRPHHLSVPQGPAGLEAGAPHPDHGGRRSMAAIASSPSTDSRSRIPNA